MNTTPTVFLLCYGPDGEPFIVRARFADRIDGSHYWSEGDLGHGIDPLTNPPILPVGFRVHARHRRDKSVTFRYFSQQINLSFLSLMALLFAQK